MGNEINGGRRAEDLSSGRIMPNVILAKVTGLQLKTAGFISPGLSSVNQAHKDLINGRLESFDVARPTLTVNKAVYGTPGASCLLAHRRYCHNGACPDIKAPS
jgi:hypothetical protein